MTNPNLSHRIKVLRKKKSLTASALGELIGVSRSAVTLWETGKTVPRPATLRLVANILSVNYHWLETGEGQMEGDQKNETEYPKLKGTQDAMIFRSPPPPDRDPDLKLLVEQVKRIYYNADKETVGKLRGYVAAIDPGYVVNKPE